jgi:hypothetical protein
MSASRSRGRERALAAMAFGVGCLFSLAGSESFLRWWERHLEQKRLEPPPSVEMIEANPTGAGSYRLKPNLRLDVRIKGRTIRVETNRFGMRWPDVTLEKPPRRRRIAVLGDSFAFGAWASTIDKSFVGVLQAGLQKRYEVLNFGAGGYGLDDEELLLHELVFDRTTSSWRSSTATTFATRTWAFESIGSKTALPIWTRPTSRRAFPRCS